MALDPDQFPRVLTVYLELTRYPILADRIRERMRHELFQRGVILGEVFENEVLEKARESQVREGITDPQARLGSRLPHPWRRGATAGWRGRCWVGIAPRCATMRCGVA